MTQKRQHIPIEMRRVVADMVREAATKRKLVGCGAGGLAEYINKRLGTTIKPGVAWKIAKTTKTADHFSARKHKTTVRKPEQLALPGGEADRLWNEIKSINQRLFDLSAKLDSIVTINV